MFESQRNVESHGRSFLSASADMLKGYGNSKLHLTNSKSLAYCYSPGCRGREIPAECLWRAEVWIRSLMWGDLI